MDPLIASGLISGIGSAVGGGLGLLGQHNANVTAGSIADENLRRQDQVFAYQRDLQRDLLLREDNAMQRRVADLKKAGLSPILAAGQGARAGNAISVTAPQRSERQVDVQQQSAGHVTGAMKAMAEMGKTLAEAALTDRQREGQEIQNKIAKEEFWYLEATLASRVNQENDKGTVSYYWRDMTVAQHNRVIDLHRVLQGLDSNYANVTPEILAWRLRKSEEAIREHDAELWRTMRELGMFGQVLRTVGSIIR